MQILLRSRMQRFLAWKFKYLVGIRMFNININFHWSRWSRYLLMRLKGGPKISSFDISSENAWIMSLHNIFDVDCLFKSIWVPFQRSWNRTKVELPHLYIRIIHEVLDRWTSLFFSFSFLKLWLWWRAEVVEVFLTTLLFIKWWMKRSTSFSAREKVNRASCSSILPAVQFYGRRSSLSRQFHYWNSLVTKQVYTPKHSPYYWLKNTKNGWIQLIFLGLKYSWNQLIFLTIN